MSASKDAEANSGAGHDGFQNNSSSNLTVTIESLPKPLKSLFDAYILLVPLGLFGAHHFYLRRPGWGFLYLFTFGLCGIGWLSDIFRMPNLVQNANNEAMYGRPNKTYDLLDTWVIGLCPITGLLGFHHYYLGRTGWGVLYTFTLGLCCLGWFFDNFRMPFLVKRANMKYFRNREEQVETHDQQSENQEPFVRYHLDDVYVLAFNPFGMLGLHHFYLKRYGWGTLYLLTCGVFGIGWLVDLIRMKILVDQKNTEIFHRNHAIYHHSTVPSYGATTLPPAPQYQVPQQQTHHGYQPGTCDYRPSVTNDHGITYYGQHPVLDRPSEKKDGITIPGGNEYPQPTNTGFPNANYGDDPPPYSS